MEQHQSFSASQSQPAQPKSAQREDPPGLALPTAGRGNLAYLEQDSTGCVYLYFRELHFGVDDCVPDSLVRSQSISPGRTAGDFVYKLMLTCYGYRDDGWPPLARRFLWQRTTGQPCNRT
jgi:hypothetical protein